MTEVEQLGLQNEILHRRVTALEADVAELERERAGLLAEVSRLRERTFALAAQVSGTP